jgi:hypothetical protein
VAYRHGLRAKEPCELEWSQIEFGRSAALHVRRAKNGKPSVHPIRGDELRMLTAIRKKYPDSGYVFTTERGTPFTPDAINRLVKTIGKLRSYRCQHTFTCCGIRAATARQRWHRHPGDSGLAGARFDHAHDQVHSVRCSKISGGTERRSSVRRISGPLCATCRAPCSASSLRADLSQPSARQRIQHATGAAGGRAICGGCLWVA